MLEEPVIELRVFIGGSPGIMPGIRINCQFGIASSLLDRFHHFLGPSQWNHIILGSMKSPDGQVAITESQDWLTPSTDWSNCREPIRLLHPQSLGPEATHADASGINTFFIHGITRLDIIEQREKLIT